MNSNFPSKNCFICCKEPVNFHKTSDSDLNICHIICQHFWFKEDDLQTAIVCGICWEKVDQFHQFYRDVQKLHEQQEAAPLSVFIKQEEIEIEEDQLHVNCIDLPVHNLKPFDIVDCKLENAEKCTELLEEESTQEPQKKRKYTRRPPGERNAKRKNPHSRKLLTPEARQAEDDFIKQHTFYFCDECNIEFENFRAIKRHRIKSHNKRTVVCCGTQYRTRVILYQHVQNVLNPEAFKCEICNGTFKSKSGYLRHKKENHTARKEPVFKCHRCEKSFTKEGILKSHLMEHETLDNETAKCELCGKCFRRKLFLKKHIKAVHQKPTDFICEICSKGFYRRGMFLAHRKTHELTAEQLRKQCPVCNKWMKNHTYWLKHVQRHREEGKEYKCEVCGHVSINLMALKVHMSRNHAPDRKRHVCELCGKEYSRATTLREHVANAHTGEPLYQCPYCEKKFFSNATMYSHRKKEHPQEWLEDHLAKYATSDSREDGSSETVS
ncbi:transcription factor grauzone-like [Ochlerotatus camptorhynchus]|uniref:transcription factor grauzone-like n=1 Tax=Ochlerotatus camptorhynchus TaxID=644619 RepID=UPI0031D03375